MSLLLWPSWPLASHISSARVTHFWSPFLATIASCDQICNDDMVRKKDRRSGGRRSRLDAKRKVERRRKRQLDSSGPNVDVSLPLEMEADREEDAGSEASYHSSSEEFGEKERAPAAEVRG
jgi:hypothetical protein